MERLNPTTGQWEEVRLRGGYGENDCDKVLVVGGGDAHRKEVGFRDRLAGEDLRHGRVQSLQWRGLYQET